MERVERQQIKKEDPTEERVEEIVKATMGKDAFEREDKSPEPKDLGAAVKKEKKEEPEVNTGWLHRVGTERNRLMGKVEVAEKKVEDAQIELEKAKKELEERKEKLEFFQKELAATKKLLAELEAIQKVQKVEKLSKDKKEKKKEEEVDKEQLAA